MRDKLTFLCLIPLPEFCRNWRLPGMVRDLLSADGTLYLRRFYLGARTYIHYIAQADTDRHLHNHPWLWARARILRGGYLEQRGYGQIWRSPGDVVRLSAKSYHRITLVLPGTLTLFRHGPRTASWGFDVSGVHVDHKIYLQL